MGEQYSRTAETREPIVRWDYKEAGTQRIRTSSAVGAIARSALTCSAASGYVAGSRIAARIASLFIRIRVSAIATLFERCVSMSCTCCVWAAVDVTHGVDARRVAHMGRMMVAGASYKSS